MISLIKHYCMNSLCVAYFICCNLTNKLRIIIIIMNKAPDFGSVECRFESCHACTILLLLEFNSKIKLGDQLKTSEQSKMLVNL